MSQCIPIELAGMKTQLLLRVPILHQESLPLFSTGQILLSGKNHAFLPPFSTPGIKQVSVQEEVSYFFQYFGQRKTSNHEIWQDKVAQLEP